ncbi:unnamed protein product [Spirodela intermedia]|uniref:Uncharacterized protein n=1 Tax=Spirodela intermedia TaxID=51605 RepID=A0A7I8JRG5_SPIIN|nr:unnamed protein product [Spirodela intermedia]CAA6672355.1 unnamed protein product [Spirodela intermedia]
MSELATSQFIGSWLIQERERERTVATLERERAWMEKATPR